MATQTNKKTQPHEAPEWKGYNLDELRYMRAYTLARIEINRERLNSRVSQIKKNGVNGIKPKGMLGKVFSAFSYFDIALLTWKVGSKALKTMKILRR